MSFSSPEQRSRLGWQTVLAPLIVVFLSLAVLVATLSTYVPLLSLPLRSTTARASFSTALSERRCLALMLRRTLPRAAVVYFGPQSAGAAQMLLELGYGWVRPTPTADGADWLATLVPSPRSGTCAGLALLVTHRP